MEKLLHKWDIDELAAIFKQAGSIALDYYESPPAELKDDLTVVTAADKAIEQLFSEYCDHADKHIYIIGEETIDKHSEEYVQEALQAECCWVLDPIDGTAAYSSYLPTWGISLGLLSKGKLIEGAIYMPVQDSLLVTCNGKIFTRQLCNESNWQEFIPRVSPLGSNGHITIGQSVAHNWGYSGSNQLFALCSCVGACYWLINGKFSGYCGTFKLWDMAGVLPLLAACGYHSVDLTAPSRVVSLDLRDGFFELAPGKNRWRVTTTVLIAADQEMLLHFQKNFYKLNTGNQ